LMNTFNYVCVDHAKPFHHTAQAGSWVRALAYYR
jgi:hypothetical protein